MATPDHVAVIMDGNGRWAKAKGLPRIMGHREGVKRVKDIVQWALEAGVAQLTLFAFGQENWHRPALEIQSLMQLLERGLEKEMPFLHEHGVRLAVVGDLAALSPKLTKRIENAVEQTQIHDKLLLTIAFSYSGQWHISDVVKQCLDEGLSFDSTDAVRAYLDQKLMVGYAHPDVFIRTSGECRISNFLLWQLAYTELFFVESYWPDFSHDDFLAVLEAYGKRQRRFGRVREEA